MTSFWLLDFNGNYSAVEAEAGLDVLKSPSLTRIPLSEPALAGLAIVAGQTLLVADLGVCLDFSPTNPAADSTLFRFQGKNTGFLTSASIRLLELHDCLILPLPEILEKNCLRGCIVVDGRAVPLMDLHQLQENFSREKRRSTSSVLKVFPELKAQNGGNWRLVRAAGWKSFALPESLFPSPLCPRPSVAVIGRMPAGMVGISYDNGRVLPVWSLGALLGEDPTAAEEFLIAGGTDLVKLAVTVEGEEEEITAGSQLPLPPWGRRPGIESALFVKGELVPCLQIDDMIRSHQNEAEEVPPLPAILPQGSWEVTEFKIGGNNHAVLKEEVADVLQPLPWFRIPGLLPLIEGVAFWQDDIWPVVNLSCYFGGKPDSSDIECMLALQRGPHRLLLLCERFEGHRLIAPGDQRHLPLKVPHSLVSGCYLDGNAVILLLDAPALVHHFEPSLVRNFRSALRVETESEKEEKVIQGIIAAENPAGIPGGRADESEARAAAGEQEEVCQGKNAQTTGEENEAPSVESEAPAVLEQASSLDPEPILKETPAPDLDTTAVLEQVSSLDPEPILKETPAPDLDTTTVLEQVSSLDPEPILKETPAPDLDTTAVLEQVSSLDPEPILKETPAPDLDTTAVLEQVSSLDPEWRKYGRPTAKNQGLSSGPFTRATPKKFTKVTSAGILLLAGLIAGWWLLRPSADLPRQTLIPIEEKVKTADIPQETEQPKPAGPTLTVVESSPAPASGLPGVQVLITHGIPVKPSERDVADLIRKVTENQMDPVPGNDEQIMFSAPPTEEISAAPENTVELAALLKEVESPDTHTSTGKSPKVGQAAVTASNFIKTDESQAPLIAPVERGFHLVRKGDTLWDLSGRYLKDPYHYGEVARENNILDPHWIYPGQILVIETGSEFSSTE
jgi:chemotaxis signal transduction protein